LHETATSWPSARRTWQVAGAKGTRPGGACTKGLPQRSPAPHRQTDGGLSYIASFRKKFQNASELEAWQSFCRILLASDDYLYVD
jgi:hypothetical protein